ncbi:MAG: hypothetical protein RL154_871 [Pseudomonadota bacterium]|jgi:hypothetical protein
MKHLKIAFAIVFFCLMGGANAELMAQKSKYKIVVGVYSLENTNCSIKSFNGTYTFEISSKKMSIMDNSKQIEVWSVQYADTPACSFTIQSNGSFHLTQCGEGNELVWKSGTESRGGMTTNLQMQSDGNLELYDSQNSRYGTKVIWASGTCGGVLNGCGEAGPRNQ